MSDPHEALHELLGEDYELLDVLGQGGMGTVYLARDRRHDRQVAIKTLNPDLISGTAPKRFEREIAITARLQHPHILPLIDSGVAGGYRYYVAPYVEGESLAEYLTRCPKLPLDTALRIAQQVAEALEYAHRQGVVHRDIKPGNILLADDQVMIADFGVARPTYGDESTLTAQGESVGTVAYMSPEQALARDDMDGRTDIYSLACVLFEMLAGRPPYVARSPTEVIKEHVFAKPPPLGRFRGDVPRHVEATIRQALAKQPDLRQGTAGDFATSLASPGAIGILGGASRSGNLRKQLGPWVLAGVLAVALVLVLWLG
jgi:serine/threonine-protein kinase